MFKKVMKLHFVGIGGSGMSGIAEVLLNAGYPVTGSDKKKSDLTARLEKLGAKVFEGHQASNVGDAEGIVVSNAVPETNPEVMEARRKKIPVIPRAQMLNELMRLKYGVCISGTHGKTTTTSMTGLVLKEGGFDPTIVIGGVLDSVGSNTLLGKGDYFVVEACEAFGSFLQLSPAICVVTNIDNDHLDHYQNMDNLRDAFVRFINRLPFYGFALVCGDDAEITHILPRVVRKTITYGFKEGNDLRAHVEKAQGLTTTFSLYKGTQKLGSATLKMPGKHNVLNAVAAIGVGMELGMSFAEAARGIEQFSGVRRRFQVKGESQGVTVVDDYAHHPTELDATLKGARDALRGQSGRLVVAFQPHLFSRTQLLYKDFASVLEQADEVYLCGIYPAREAPIPGVSSQLIVDLLETREKPHVTYCFDPNDLLPKIMKDIKPGDLFITAGAGTIDQLGEKVLAELKKKARAGVTRNVNEWAGLGMALGPGKLLLNEPMARHSSFKIGGPAEALAKPGNVAELRACLDFAKTKGMPLFFLAGGTNLLVKDGGILGLTIKLEGEFKEIVIEGTTLKAGAGANLALVSKKAGLAGLSGLEFAVGIPGSLGGGLVMNAGAHGGELSQVVTEITLLEGGDLKTIPGSEAGFEYRNSRFKNSGALLLSAVMKLAPGDKPAIEKKMEEALSKRKATQPLNLPNAGCVFKNPAGGSAGKMIEEAGLKGIREGGAQISELHANFVVNQGGARASDVLALMARARVAVKEKFGVELENEVLIVGQD